MIAYNKLHPDGTVVDATASGTPDYDTSTDNDTTVVFIRAHDEAFVDTGINDPPGPPPKLEPPKVRNKFPRPLKKLRCPHRRRRKRR